MTMFQKATKKQARLRMAFVGPSGSGKTFSALRVASGLGKKVALVDTERGSAAKYADRFSFDVLELDEFSPKKYMEAIRAAGDAGYEVLVIDSLSHAWNGKGGALEMVDQAAVRSKSKDSFGAWREVTPIHNELVDTILRAKCHVIVTMRVKQEYVLEKNDNGKMVPRKVGLAPVQRDGMEYEFDVVGDLDDAKLVITKSRCPALNKTVVNEPGEDLANVLKAWLTEGESAPEPMREAKPNPDAKKARAAKLWADAQRRGMDKDAFKVMVEKTLGAPKPSADWTGEDFEALENALPSAPAEVPV